MKKSTLFLPLALVLFMPHQRAAAQAGFEGTITWSISIPQMDEESHSMIMNIKGDKTEQEMDMGVQGLIKTYMDRGKKKMYVAMMSMKQGMSMDMNEDAKSTGKDDIELKPTGKKSTIAGHAAEEYLITSPKGDLSLWAASDFPADIREGIKGQLGHNPGQDSKQSHAFKQLSDKGLVPVKVEMKEAGEVQMSMEFVKYEMKKLDDAVFALPTDIKFNPMPAGMGGH